MENGAHRSVKACANWLTNVFLRLPHNQQPGRVVCAVMNHKQTLRMILKGIRGLGYTIQVGTASGATQMVATCRGSNEVHVARVEAGYPHERLVCAYLLAGMLGVHIRDE